MIKIITTSIIIHKNKYISFKNKKIDKKNEKEE